MITIKEDYYNDDKETCFIDIKINIDLTNYFNDIEKLPDITIEHELDELVDKVTNNINKAFSTFDFNSELKDVEISRNGIDIFIKDAGTVETESYTDRPSEYARYEEEHKEIYDDTAEFEIEENDAKKLAPDWLPRKIRFDYDVTESDVTLEYVSDIYF